MFRVAYSMLWAAIRSLRRHVMSSLLTCLGIIIGIAAVIAVVEIGHAARVERTDGIAVHADGKQLQAYFRSRATSGMALAGWLLGGQLRTLRASSRASSMLPNILSSPNLSIRPYLTMAKIGWE